MIRKFFVTCFLVFISTNSISATYKWVDDKGTVGYSDDIGSIPKRYRANAVVIEENQQSVEIIEGQSQNKPLSGEKIGNELSAKGSQGNKAKPLYDGKDEESWKKDFAKLNSDITGTEDFLSEKKARLSDTAKMSRGEYMSLQNSIKDAEVRLDVLKKKLEALESSALKAKVPRSAF